MKKFAIAAVAVLSLVSSSAVYAQYHHFGDRGDRMQRMRMDPQDRAAFVDARIAAVHAGLKLNADQEKLWPPVEAAVRDFIKLRSDRANARMEARRNQSEDQQKSNDPVAQLRQRADNMAATAAAMKKIADAVDPLYKTLDEGQKRRLTVLTHHQASFGGEGGRERSRRMDRGGMGMDRGMDHPRGGRDRDSGSGDDSSGRL